MDLNTSNYIQPHSHSHSHGGVRKLSLNETSSELPAKKGGKRNVVEAPSTPGRPVFSFSHVASRKNQLVPSKWNDAEKWLHQNHLHGFVKSKDFVSKKPNNEDKVSVSVSASAHHHHNSDVLKDKFTNEVESFVFKEASLEVGSRDIGTEMTPLGSSATSRCHTPFKTMSPPRHNTPAAATRSLVLMESLDIQESHLAKLKPSWTSREEEEEDISKSLRHFEISNECRKSISSAWEGEGNSCLRYQREEAKIQAWVDLQNAKAEAQSRKLEVKIQKMRSKFEEKLMTKMAIVNKKADEMRAAAQLEHTQNIQKVKEEAKKTINMQFSGHKCGCFPCNNLRP